MTTPRKSPQRGPGRPLSWLEKQWAKMPPPRPRRIRHCATFWEDVYDEGQPTETHIYFNPLQKIRISTT